MEPRYRPYEVTTGVELVRLYRSGDFSLWRLNRAVDDRRVNSLVAHLKASGDAWCLGPTPVFIARSPDGNVLLDGQHRLMALNQLGASQASQFQVFVGEVMLPPGEEAVRREFERVPAPGEPQRSPD